MPRVIDLADDLSCTLDECAEALRLSHFDPHDEDSLHHASLWLRRLGNNADFFGDILVQNLANRHREDDDAQSYGPQSLILTPQLGTCFLRANIWPGKDDYLLKASGRSPFLYDLPHDHNFHFLTLGYFGPGYWSEYYEYEFDSVSGYVGEPVALTPMGLQRLEEGKIMLYRAHKDVHLQLPADALSVSLNVMHADSAMGWLDQYKFDVDAGTIGGILSNGSSETFLRTAVALGGAEAIDLAETFARSHPSDRLRVAAYDSLASITTDVADRDALWARAEAGGRRMVAAEARSRRAELTDG